MLRSHKHGYVLIKIIIHKISCAQIHEGWTNFEAHPKVQKIEKPSFASNLFFMKEKENKRKHEETPCKNKMVWLPTNILHTKCVLLSSKANKEQMSF